ncbi:MAG: hypothetical protein QOD12_1929 [Verrucomicrobiota bacterium]
MFPEGAAAAEAEHTTQEALAAHTKARFIAMTRNFPLKI